MTFEDLDNTKNDTDKLLSPQEITAIKKDLHMTGRALRVGESLSDYKKERLDSWLKITEDQNRQDQLDIEAAREIIDTTEGPRPENKDDFENYKKLANVKIAIQKLRNLLNQNQSQVQLAERAKEIIYDMLTQRSEFVENTILAGKNALDLKNSLPEETKWYRQTRDQLEKAISSEGDLSWESNPGWFGINTRPEEARRNDINFKTYLTIPSIEYKFIQYLPELAGQLRQLSLSSDDIIKVKIPESFSVFTAKNDSLVVHFKKKENSGAIMDIINKWLQKNNIHEEPREMDRTKIAADSNDTSFSKLITDNIGNWFAENAGKYDPDILVNEAVRHAINQSQKSPIKIN